MFQKSQILKTHIFHAKNIQIGPSCSTSARTVTRLTVYRTLYIPDHLLKDVGLPEFSWSPEPGACWDHLWKRVRCFVSVVSRLLLGLYSGSRGSVLFADPSGDTRQGNGFHTQCAVGPWERKYMNVRKVEGKDFLCWRARQGP